MVEFKVEDMTCNHCVNHITKALKEVDPHADIRIDKETKIVCVDSSAETSKLIAAIEEAGYTPVMNA